ncbi:hypothetical protein P7K49_026226 [Saguinus oedipus]|uniref:Uncharacterized protein n=1 Tax=Saguinus oedipus TaxID=9490 RepID=A0ABQ9UDF2_SAGOE|nr:hypothetical protein P7K49_026226 [Saguinus oedipus]
MGNQHPGRDCCVCAYNEARCQLRRERAEGPLQGAVEGRARGTHASERGWLFHAGCRGGSGSTQGMTWCSGYLHDKDKVAPRQPPGFPALPRRADCPAGSVPRPPRRRAVTGEKRPLADARRAPGTPGGSSSQTAKPSSRRRQDRLRPWQRLTNHSDARAWLRLREAPLRTGRGDTAASFGARAEARCRPRSVPPWSRWSDPLRCRVFAGNLGPTAPVLGGVFL